MSLTPSNPRMSGGSVRLTPSPSPYQKNTPLRSPTKSQRTEASLALRQAIGTTTNSANAFDSVSSARSFAFCAGAAAVMATVDEEHHVSQRFFRARPTVIPINGSASVYGGPPTPTQNESRNRTAASLRDTPIGGSPLAAPANDKGDSTNNKAWLTRDRIKAATCVAFSADGKFLAVGETGYKPRVLIFSTSADAPSDTPLTALTEHTFGVKCIAFSPDSQFLASLGSSNDGYLYVWSINARTGAAALHSSNKCTSNINRMAWMGNSIVTVGTRHVKVWRIEDPTTPRSSKTRQSEAALPSIHAQRALPGRNCILDNLLEVNFTSVVAVAPSKAIVASDKGHVCLIDDSDGTQKFTKIAEAESAVTSLAVDSKGRLHLASSQGGLKTLNIESTIGTLTPPPSPPPMMVSPTVILSADSMKIEAMASLADYLVTVDSQHSIRLSLLCASDDDSLIGDVVQRLPAHGSSVLGVSTLKKPNEMDASFYTWAAGGSVLFWSHDGVCKEAIHVHLEQIEGADAEQNELKTVRSSNDASFIVAGDKYGILRIIDCQTQASAFQFKAHSNEITSVAIFEGKEPYIATCARDRMVQVFHHKADGWDLMQTLDEHVGAVTGVAFSRNGDRLVSMSADRSIVVRELASLEGENEPQRAFLMLRTVMLKATPMSIAWDIEQDDVLLVSTVDRHVHKYDLRNGQCLSSFRASDTDGGDAVVLSSLVHIPRGWGTPLIAGVSSTDKSIRLYDENGTLVARDWGHTEGVTDIALIESGEPDDETTEKALVTVAVDGTIFLWGLQLQPLSRGEVSKSVDLLGPSTPTHQSLLANKPPLRRVLSQSEIAKFPRSPDCEQLTPTGNRSPKLRKRGSKMSLASSAPKLDPSPMTSTARDRLAGSSSQSTLRRSNRNRSPSPPSPRHPQLTKRRSSVDIRMRSKAPASEFGSLGALTESLNRTLRSYRKRLASSNDGLSPELLHDVERELALTSRVVGEKMKSNGLLNETVMQKLLDQYSERLLVTLDEKIAASVAIRLRESSESGISNGLASPAFEKDDEKGMEKDDEKGMEKDDEKELEKDDEKESEKDDEKEGEEDEDEIEAEPQSPSTGSKAELTEES
ncbi:WD repeat protein-like protein [Massarina eburnea CBS 473.64]|uniref:WD repeat protein-like protein n=1 Tax=Massarina eburnea CBS 473.64 TaxID=1395130 RepID=A0A6A6RUT6_9PLEO|nr:WD repeat protein-like protein [Massarina eburnea CBS 473.64]